MNNKYRLSSNAFKREEEEERIPCNKIYFLSVEGNSTEKEYFDGISANRNRLGINAVVDVEVLKRKQSDTNSAPQQVVELLEEYLSLREYGKEGLIKDIPKDFVERYGVEFIQEFLRNSDKLTKRQKNQFVTELIKLGYDIYYRKYLEQKSGDDDEFGIVIDRDVDTHSEINMLECIEYCKEKNYACYIANPCFEFWLLLHLSDVKSEYSDRMQLIKNNKKVSDQHTFVSKEVSDKAHHGKKGINFKKNYLPYVDLAILRAKGFACDEMELVDGVGCNVWKLIESMKTYNK